MKPGQTFARGLGAFSLGLGAVQLTAPRRFSRWIGVPPKRERELGVRVVGAREIGAGAGLLAMPAPPLMWSRVAGDVVDLALLGRALASRDTRPQRVGAAIAGVAAITAVDVVGSIFITREARRNGRDGRHGAAGTGSTVAGETNTGRVVKAITIARPVEDVYAFWRDFTNLPGFMRHLESVEATDAEGRRSHWRAKAPLGASVEWNAELTEDRPNERISWRSVDGQVRNAGTVHFAPAPAGRGTVVRVELEYDPPGGPLGAAIAKLTGEEPEQQTADDLRRLKQVLEVGEVVLSDATVGDRRVRQRPAQPSESGA